MIVSIHAPTRGATRRSGSTIGCYRIVSIHAPTRGATQQVLGLSRAVRGFNPRTHTGCDIVMSLVNHNYEFVSIHAPTRGATSEVYARGIERKKFQSTHPHGVRPNKFPNVSNVVLFQSTHPHGVRRKRAIGFHKPTLFCFNPRTHTGCDGDSDFTEVGVYNVSIHAPTRGATVLFIGKKRTQQVSIHAPTRGATHTLEFITSFKEFQSTHPHGVRPCIKLHIISQ